MVPTVRSALAASVLAGLLVLALPSSTRARDDEPPPFLRGMCFTSSVFQNRPEKELVAWVRESQVNLVAIDFFLPGHNYGWTDFGKIARLVKRLKKEGVTVLADYRPSTSEPGVASPGEQPDLCLSNAQVRQNIIGWGLLLLEKVPGIDILTLYNPLPRFERNKDCPSCRKLGEPALLQLLFSEWSNALKEQHPEVRLGAVFVAGEAFYGPVRQSLDVFCPFCSVVAERGEDCAPPGVMKRVAADMRDLRSLGPVIPLVKLYWKEATRNTTEDILEAMSEAKEEGLDGFFLWYWSLLTGDLDRSTPFDLPDYDLARIEARYRELAKPPPYREEFRRMRADHLRGARLVADAEMAYAHALLAGDPAADEARTVVDAAAALRHLLAEQKARLDALRTSTEARRLRQAHRRLVDATLRDLERFARMAARNEETAVRSKALEAFGRSRDLAALVREVARLHAGGDGERITGGVAHAAWCDETASDLARTRDVLSEALTAWRASARGQAGPEAAAALFRTLRAEARELERGVVRLRAREPEEELRELHVALDGASSGQALAAVRLAQAFSSGDEADIRRWASRLEAALRLARELDALRGPGSR